MAEVFNHGDLRIGSSIIFNNDATEFPLNPKPHQVFLKSGILYIYTKIASTEFFSWLPLAAMPSSYLHNQTTPASTWTINHGLKSLYVGVFVYDDAGELQFVTIETTSPDVVTINLSEEISGKCVIFAADAYSATTLSGTTINVGNLVLGDTDNNLTINGDSVQKVTNGATLVGFEGPVTTYQLNSNINYLINEVNCNNGTLLLPSNPSIGDTVQIYCDGTTDPVSILVSRNGSFFETLEDDLLIDTSQYQIRLIFVGGLIGWKYYL